MTLPVVQTKTLEWLEMAFGVQGSSIVHYIIRGDLTWNISKNITSTDM